MARTCPRCTQVSPDEALYCWLDGAALDGPVPAVRPEAVGVHRFPFPFVFISGRSCRNFDELLLACESNWDEASELLRDGSLEGFFKGLGRSELAAVARRCAREPDPSIGLDRLLDQFPGEARMPPRLVVRPQEFNLGQLRPGTDRRFDLILKNEGMGLLTGSAACGGADWLALGDDAPVLNIVFQCRDEVRLTVRVVGERLRAGRPQEGQLFIASSGGPGHVVIRVEAPITPFAEGVLAGTDSPRSLAAKAKAAPVQAAVLFENGAVAAWYKANGWAYPIQGPRASGVAAVQQFFEALGLSAPPRVEIDRQTVELEGPPGAPLEAALTLQAIDARPIFAHAVSLAPWLTIGPAVLAGRSARIPLRVAAVPDCPGERLTGELHVTANGKQHFIVEVGLTISGRQNPFGPAALPSLQKTMLAEAYPPSPFSGVSPPAPTPAAPASAPNRWMWAAACALLLLAFAAAATTAVVVWMQGGASGTAEFPPAPEPDPTGTGAWEDAPAGAPFEGHASPILAIAFTGDGKMLTASGGVENRDGKTVLAADNAIHLWDAASGREIKRLRGLKGGVVAAAFSTDGHYAAVAGYGADHAVHLWDLHEAREVQPLLGHNGTVACLAFTADGRRVVSGGADGMVHIWEVETGEPLAPLKGHEGSINSVAVSRDGHYVLSGGGDHSVLLWDLRRMRFIRPFDGHKDIVWTTAFSPDGRFALSAGGGEYKRDHSGLTRGTRDFDVRLWEVSSGKVVRPYKGHGDAVGVVVFSPDGERILTAGGEQDGAFLWRTGDAKQLRHFDGHKGLVRCAAFFPDGRRAVTGGEDAALKVWELPVSAPELLKLLAGDDAAARLRAVRDLADCGPEATLAVRPLLRGLKEGDADFRREALRTLPKIPAPTQADVELLTDLVKDATFPQGRDYALDALAPLGAAARPAALPAYNVLMDGSAGSVTRSKAAKVLAGIGPNPDVRAFADLFVALRDPNPQVAQAVAEALSKLCPQGKDDILDLQFRLRDDAPAVRRYALLSLTALGTDARSALPTITQLLFNDSLPDVRQAAVLALAAIAPNEPGSMEAFTKALADADPTVPPAAVKALAQAGLDHGALPGLIQALNHKDDAVRKAAEDVLKNARLDKTHIRLLSETLKAGSPVLRERVLGVLEAVGPDAGEAAPGLIALLRSGPPDLRRRAVDLLVQTGPAAKQAGPALSNLLDEKDKAVRFQAALALANIGAAEAKEGVGLLVTALWVANQDDAAAVARRDKAREALATIGAPAVKALTTATASEFADGPNAPNSEANAWARLTAVRALKEMGPAARAPETFRLLEYLDKNDPAVDVRIAARDAMGAIGR